MEKHGRMWGVDKHLALQIAGTPGERDKVVASIEWMGACAVEQHRNIAREIYDIACLSYIKNHCVFPLRRSVVFSSSNMHFEGPEKLGRMLAASANYIQLCHSLGKYRMCNLDKLPEFKGLGV